MSISGVGGTSNNWSVPQQTNSVKQPAGNQPSRLQIPQDTLEISEAAQMMSELQSSNSSGPERAELIARIQSEIASGAYDTEEKMEMAFMKFLQQASHDEDLI